MNDTMKDEAEREKCKKEKTETKREDEFVKKKK